MSMRVYKKHVRAAYPLEENSRNYIAKEKLEMLLNELAAEIRTL